MVLFKAVAAGSTDVTVTKTIRFGVPLLLGLGFTFQEIDRWLALTYAAILLTGFSLGWAYSLGGFLWPVGVIMLIFSLKRLAKYKVGKTRPEL